MRIPLPQSVFFTSLCQLNVTNLFVSSFASDFASNYSSDYSSDYTSNYASDYSSDYMVIFFSFFSPFIYSNKVTILKKNVPFDDRHGEKFFFFFF